MLVVPRVPPFDRRATYDDLVAVADHLAAEIVDGELHADPRPAPGVASSVLALGGMLLRGLGGSAGPDAWQVLPGPELHLGADVLAPGLAAWRRSRLPEWPAAPYFSVPPDWVCETLSSGTASLRARKMAIYAGERVSHAWLIDPAARSREVRRVQGGRWTVVATHVGDQVVRAEPFEAVELPLAAVWPRESASPPFRRSRA
jgi:hypothetical protein